MENKEVPFVVEFLQPQYDVVYFREVVATDIAAAKQIILNAQPDSVILAVTRLSETA
jgi:hypothetical protein